MEASWSGQNHTLQRQCIEMPERIMAEHNMDAHGKYMDDRSDGILACTNEKNATTGFNILRLAANYNFDGQPVRRNANDAPRIDYGRYFPLDSQRGLATFLEIAARTP